jgi:hypothetical protein
MGTASTVMHTLASDRVRHAGWWTRYRISGERTCPLRSMRPFRCWSVMSGHGRSTWTRDGMRVEAHPLGRCSMSDDYADPSRCDRGRLDDVLLLLLVGL